MSAHALYGDRWKQREAILQRFEEAWKNGQRPSIQKHLELASGDKQALLVELLFLDLEYRLKSGESARVEEYVERLPSLPHDRPILVELIACEYQFRRRTDNSVAIDEYLRRFADLRDELTAALQGVEFDNRPEQTATIVTMAKRSAAGFDKPQVSPSRTTESTSSRLIEQVKRQDPDAWRHLVRLYGPLVYHWCGRFGLHNHDAADIFQDVFRAVSGGIARFRRDRPGDTFRGWLLTITRNKLRDFARNRAREPSAVGGANWQDVLAQIPADDSVHADDDPQTRSLLIGRALELISAEFEQRTWQAFWRTAVDGEPTGDVAADLGMSPTAVRIAKSRVRCRLRDALADPLDPAGM